MTVWVLTVSYVNVGTSGHAGYGAAYSYQLEYKDKKTCLEQAENHRQKRIAKSRFLEPDSYVNEHKSARCDFKQVLVNKVGK